MRRHEGKKLQALHFMLTSGEGLFYICRCISSYTNLP
jgi:hypothetical protein